MKTLTEKYRGVLNESFSKAQFVRDARIAQPSLINQFTSYNDAVSILKSKGMISEEDKLPEYAEFENLSDEAIRRGIDAELEGMGLMSHDSVSDEDQAKAKEKALKNLKKDPLHYLNLLSGESNKVDKHDKPVEFKKGKEVDTFNGMKKAELKEEVTESNQEESIANFIIKHYTNPKTGKSLIDDEIIGDFFRTHPESKDQEPQAALDNFEEYLSVNYEMPGDYMQEKVAKSVEDVIDPADYGAIGQGYLKGFNRPHSLDLDQLETLGRKVVDSLYKGDFDAAKAKFVDEVMGIDRKGNKKPETGGSDATKYKVAAKNMEEKLSDDDMKAIEKYGHPDKTVKPYKPGDMWSNDFDYEGMLEFGMKIRLNTPIATLQALYSSFEDVNYHSENSHLGMAIDAIEDGDKSEALDHIRNFKKEVKKTLVGINEGSNPNRRELEEAEVVVTERVGGLQEFISLIEDRADETGFEPREEAAEVIEALADHYKLNLKMIQNYIDSDDPVNPFADEVNEEPNEGNKFEAERLKAIEAGEDHFEVDGKKFPVKGVGADDKKRAAMAKESIKAIITKVLEEGTINEAATQELAKMADSYAGFEGMKAVVMSLQDIVTDIERYYDTTRGKIQKAFDSMGEVRNEEGLKVGGFLSPAVESAFNKDLRPVVKQGFTKGLDQPKVKVLTQADLDAARMGGPVAEAEPKQTVYSPVNEKKK